MDAGGIPWYVQEDVHLPYTDVAVLRTFTNHVREELRYHGGGESLSFELETLTLLIDQIEVGLDFSDEFRNDLIAA